MGSSGGVEEGGGGVLCSSILQNFVMPVKEVMASGKSFPQFVSDTSPK